MDKTITPLSQFPTEVLVFYFKKLRKCYTHKRCGKQIGIEKRWSPHFENVEGLGYIINYYTMYELPIWEIEYYTTTSGQFLDDTLWFKFEGMYWTGGIDELKKELDKRPNIDIKNTKDFRKWKINYKKSVK